MPDSNDKGKIIDLWKRSRQKAKGRRQRNYSRRLILITSFVLINGIIATILFQGLPNLSESILINSGERKSQDPVESALVNKVGKQSQFGLMKLDLNRLASKIKKEKPLINKIEIKPIIWDVSFISFKPKLSINYKEEIPWARFSSGWILTSSGRIIQDTSNLDLNNLSFAARSLINVNNTEYAFWESKGKQIKNLIYSVNQQLPEMFLEEITLRINESVVLELEQYSPYKHTLNNESSLDDNYSKIEISLGNWDDQILDRASKIASASPYIKKYEKQIGQIDMSSGAKAILKLKESKPSDIQISGNKSLKNASLDLKTGNSLSTIITKNNSSQIHKSQEKSDYPARNLSQIDLAKMKTKLLKTNSIKDQNNKFPQIKSLGGNESLKEKKENLREINKSESNKSIENSSPNTLSPIDNNIVLSPNEKSQNQDNDNSQAQDNMDTIIKRESN